MREIEGLQAMQEIVGGDIEATYPFADLTAVIYNADGKNLDLPYNGPWWIGTASRMTSSAGHFL